MSSLVLELQQDALNPNVSVSNLLTKALVAAKKLGVSGLETWAQNELKGYTRAQDIPEYRKVVSQPKAFDPYHGWQPIRFPNSEILATVATRPCDQSVGEIEAIVKDAADEGTPWHGFYA